MQKYQEIEMKFKLNHAEHLLKRIGDLACEHVIMDEYQCDCYYAPAHRNFFSENIISEWLRIRKTDKEETLNYKRWLPIGAEIQTHCEEYETVVSDGCALKHILEYLDFKEVIKVEKVRNCWKYADILICIDKVTELGTFIELEYAKKAEGEAVKKVLSYMEDVLKNDLQAEVEPRDRRGYPYQMMALKGLM